MYHTIPITIKAKPKYTNVFIHFTQDILLATTEIAFTNFFIPWWNLSIIILQLTLAVKLVLWIRHK